MGDRSRVACGARALVRLWRAVAKCCLGITGWAQVNGRNALSWEEKVELDVWYVDHHHLWLDVKILFFTLWMTLKREGISQPGEATAEEFRGSPRAPAPHR